MIDLQLLPLSPDQITPAFLTSILRGSSSLKLASVSEVQVEILNHDTAYNAQLARLHLQYDVQESSAPGSLIAKLPTTRTDLHDSAEVFRPGTNECWFYEHGAVRTPVNTPRVYLSAVGPSHNASFLLLEDLAPLRQFDWATGVSVEAAEIALESLARQHAAWWGFDPADEPGLAHMMDDDGEGVALVEAFYADAWPRFLAHTTCELNHEARRFGAALVGRIGEAEARLDDAPTTLIHGDYRLGNVLFKALPDGLSCWVIDWEDIHSWSGMFDVAWFLGGCLPLGQLDHELPLLRFYHHALAANGVRDYSWPQCQADYRVAMASAFVQGVLTATPSEGGATSALGHAVGQRYIAAASRLNLSSLLTE